MVNDMLLVAVMVVLVGGAEAGLQSRVEACLMKGQLCYEPSYLCYPALRRGPCPPNHWIVMDSQKGKQYLLSLLCLYSRSDSLSSGCKCRVCPAA